MCLLRCPEGDQRLPVTHAARKRGRAKVLVAQVLPPHTFSNNDGIARGYGPHIRRRWLQVRGQVNCKGCVSPFPFIADLIESETSNSAPRTHSHSRNTSNAIDHAAIEFARFRGGSKAWACSSEKTLRHLLDNTRRRVRGTGRGQIFGRTH